MPVIDQIKEKLDKETVLWVVAFVGTCVLVGFGKLRPETIEMFLFAVIGRASAPAKKLEGQ